MPTTSQIEAEVSIPDILHLPPGNKSSVAVDVLARLHNRGDEDYLVGTSDPSDVHEWHVLNENHREVMRPKASAKPKGTKDVHPHSSELVPAGHSHSCPATLVLDAKKLKAGKRYTLRYVYHGYVAEADFAVVEGKATAPARRRATPKKKPAGKSPGRRATSKSTSKKTK